MGLTVAARSGGRRREPFEVRQARSRTPHSFPSGRRRWSIEERFLRLRVPALRAQAKARDTPLGMTARDGRAGGSRAHARRPFSRGRRSRSCQACLPGTAMLCPYEEHNAPPRRGSSPLWRWLSARPGQARAVQRRAKLLHSTFLSVGPLGAGQSKRGSSTACPGASRRDKSTGHFAQKMIDERRDCARHKPAATLASFGGHQNTVMARTGAADFGAQCFAAASASADSRARFRM